MSKYSTFLPRFFAGIVDGIVFWPISWVEQSLVQAMPALLATALQYLFTYDWLIYSVALHTIWGQTVGKMVTRVKVTSYPNEGAVTFKQAFLRDSVLFVFLSVNVVLSFFAQALVVDPTRFLSVLFILGFSHFLWFLVELLTMLANEKRRAFHDFIAGTVVVRT